MAHVLKKKSRQQQRATGPTYKAGLPACTQGAVGRVVTGLRVGGKIKGQTKQKIPLKIIHGQCEDKGGKKI